MKHMKWLVMLLMSFLLLFPGCSLTGASGGNLMAGIAAKPWPSPPASLESKSVDSLNGFSWELFRQSVSEKGNVLVSPASVYLALGMVLNGAANSTREGMLQAMHAQGLTDADINTFCRDWLGMMKLEDGKTQLKAANSIWYGSNNKFKPDTAFLQRNADYFDALAYSMDFRSPDAAKSINTWISKATNGVIKQAVDKISPETMMFLIDALYFKSDWAVPFKAAATRDGEFHAPEASVQVKFMNRTGEMNYMDQGGVQEISLPYIDGRFTFFAVMPATGTSLKDFVGSLDAKGLYALANPDQKGPVQLSLPKFQMNYDVKLKSALSQMGMNDAFDMTRADFSLMDAQRIESLFIDDVKQNAAFRVDELGSEAAAVTIVTMAPTASAPPPTLVKITFDRPFIYGIWDSHTGSPLFLGVMEDPSAK